MHLSWYSWSMIEHGLEHTLQKRAGLGVGQIWTCCMCRQQTWIQMIQAPAKDRSQCPANSGFGFCQIVRRRHRPFFLHLGPVDFWDVGLAEHIGTLSWHILPSCNSKKLWKMFPPNISKLRVRPHSNSTSKRMKTLAIRSDFDFKFSGIRVLI